MGQIRGIVLTMDLVPVQDAHLLLQPTDRTALTDEGGSFSFIDLAAGPYRLAIQKAGFRTLLEPIEVRAAEVLSLTIRLSPIPQETPRSLVWGPEAGFIQCRSSMPFSNGPCGYLPLIGDPGCGINQCLAPTLWPNDKNALRFLLEGDDWRHIVLEARWTPSTFATDSKMMQYFSYENHTESHYFASSEANQSATSMTFTRGQEGHGGQLRGNEPKEPNTNLTLVTWLSLPPGSINDFPLVNVVYELRFELIVTIFYSQEVAAEYSAFQG